MREKELRIALVCFGGVSLAVYMQGICKEILPAQPLDAAARHQPIHLHKLRRRKRAGE